ncbi:SRR1-like protein isoform X1 [Engystomops pustulosus]|uniref:SRR1-like protein isoform X1 n=2 Tax=Engystomops pustulosus TaxID=76066 RepID=UPI003AFB1AB9
MLYRSLFQHWFKMESDTWQTVNKKKASKKSSHLKNKTASTYSGAQQPPNMFTTEDVTATIKRINETMADLQVSDFWHSCQGCLLRCPDTLAESSPDVSINEGLMKNLNLEDTKTTCISLENVDCVCYGLGNFTTCVISRHQLAFLIVFLEQFKIPKHQCHVFDPIFSMLEIEVLQQLGLSVLLKNEEGKHAVCKSTLFYMPHCGKALYNNLLWRNWSCDALSQIMIIGNSFKGIEERLVSRILQRDYIYIYKSLQVVEETSFPESSHYGDVFNDTAIHRFSVAKLKSLPKETWQCQDEPQYQDCEDLEIILGPKG